MGKGVPCPMPAQHREAIRARITQWRAEDRNWHEYAPLLQDVWPGCTSNHVRGVIAGLQSGKTGLRAHVSGIKRHVFKKPWTPGGPKP